MAANALGNHLAHVRRKALTRTNADILSIGYCKQSQKTLNRKYFFFYKRCIWKFHLRNSSHFVFRPQCVNWPERMRPPPANYKPDSNKWSIPATSGFVSRGHAVARFRTASWPFLYVKPSLISMVITSRGQRCKTLNVFLTAWHGNTFYFKFDKGLSIQSLVKISHWSMVALGSCPVH